jgi:hypothetical protein
LSKRKNQTNFLLRFCKTVAETYNFIDQSHSNKKRSYFKQAYVIFIAGFLSVNFVERSSVAERISKQWYGAFPANGEQTQLGAICHSFTVAIN